MKFSVTTVRRAPRWLSGNLVALAVLGSESVVAAAPITYTDIAQDPASGITYRRKESAHDAVTDALRIRPVVSIDVAYSGPQKPDGAPGVALLDYDRDGDLDIYVPNGPGRANSLYQNQYAATGQATFIDVATTAGVDATSQDSTGTCYGDIDNDGDDDLVVLGNMQPSRMFQNNGNGTFTDITASAGVAQVARGYTSCSMGDINGDGLLDIAVSAAFDPSSLQAIFRDYFSYNHPNALFLNKGGNVFQDVSSSSGLLNLYNVPAGSATISHAISLVDYDQDGDADIFHADDQGAIPNAGFAGVDRGLIQLFKNDGTGVYANVTGTSGSVAMSSGWMGLSFGDVNCDGHMDAFATSFGDYMLPSMGFATPNGLDSSRYHLALGTPEGVFTTPFNLPNGLHANPFGWGTGMADYDNDADTDIIYYGNLGVGFLVSADNPGVILSNDGCTGSFTWDSSATAANAQRVARQTVQGVALGDLNNDGFTDIVHVSGQYVPETVPLVPVPSKFQSVFDDTAWFLPTFIQIGPLEYEWSGHDVQEGFLGVNLSSASSGNHWAKVKVDGSKGIVTNGKVNRSGIGAIVRFTPQGGAQAMSPVLGGSSYGSQHSLVQGFGMGAATTGMVEVFWPGAVKNRLYDVAAGETVSMPEIPCDFAKTWPSRQNYRQCVDGALNELRAANRITTAERTRLRTSALRAYDETH